MFFLFIKLGSKLRPDLAVVSEKLWSSVTPLIAL